MPDGIAFLTHSRLANHVLNEVTIFIDSINNSFQIYTVSKLNIEKTNKMRSFFENVYNYNSLQLNVSTLEFHLLLA